ncbi:MAG: PilT/PilU family type 4a pilus ATPase [Clostridia bacterium]|nr:PilT/PilU family type 4a pilus ATPase [Clostridia bacterium]
MDLLQIINLAIEMSASDIFIVPGRPVCIKQGRSFVSVSDECIMTDASEILIREAYAMTDRDFGRLACGGDDDFCISCPGKARLRVSAYMQRGSYAAVFRIISFGIPDYRTIGIPENVMAAAEENKGLTLITGSAGNGKSTTLACIIDRINHTRMGHIITLEDPVEYLHRHDKCIISQREISIDTKDYVTALRASLRQAPDVILLGEMRDHETISTAMTAAETGHLVFSTLHTLGAENTVDRIIDCFPPEGQKQIRVQLAMVLNSVISQQLIPTLDGSLVPVFEVVHANMAIRNLIREARVHQLDAMISASRDAGMISMDDAIYELYRDGRITRDTALQYAMHPDILRRRLN